MISQNKFIKLMELYQENQQFVDNISELIPNFFECTVVEFGWKMFEELLQSYFTLEGVDWINYYLYENPEKCYYQDEQKILLETIEDLWNTIAIYRKHTDD